MSPHTYGSCHNEDCPACMTRAFEQPEDFDGDGYGWAADEAAEREAERGWRWVS